MVEDTELIPELVSDNESSSEIKYVEAPKIKQDAKGRGLRTEKVEKKVPVTILTGYLGSGKSTLLERIAARGDMKLAIILNEFGDSVEIEKSLTIRDKDDNKVEEWLDLGNGCLCCSVKNNGVAAIERLVANRKGFDHILLETTGLADPAPIATMFWLDDALSSNVYIDGVVTVLDSESIEKWLDDAHNDHDHALQMQEERHHAKIGKGLTIAHLQIAMADTILLNKIDKIEADPSRVEEIKRRVSGINSMAPIYETKFGDIDLHKILGLHAYETKNVENLIKNSTDYHDHSMTSVTLNFAKLKDEAEFERFELFLQKVLWKEEEDDDDNECETTTDIHRTKGLIFIGDNDYKVIQGVRKTYDILDGVKAVEDLGLDNSRLVMIGRNIDSEEMKRILEDVSGIKAF
ncbi:DEKNAAC104658 [Brettanomyces naardenensis]|uniref:DEKNAAC104658 n=1 Tax=Brettanomyces naardenensis TaxID=13370 RepID=A0A448YRK0_BRENA|nr:DEKNAAC104658 [Brettanomyces naardenensis]